MEGGRSPLEALLERERLVVGGALALLGGLAWYWLLTGAGTGMSVTAMTSWSFPPPDHPSMFRPWSLGHAIVVFLMWWVMMIAMMTPSVAPTVLLYARVHRFERERGKIRAATTPTFSFVAGYLCAWLGFSAFATALQWSLERAGLVDAMLMWSVSAPLSAALLVAAGAYQLSPLKGVCLRHCRAPARFLSERYRPGAAGALRMGLEHGAYCLGCCWVLMALLFAGGIMNLVWIVGLTVLVLLEKIAPWGHRAARVAGVAMIVAGALVLLRQALS